jgi:hypothetical protein
MFECFVQLVGTRQLGTQTLQPRGPRLAVSATRQLRDLVLALAAAWKDARKNAE